MTTLEATRYGTARTRFTWHRIVGMTPTGKSKGACGQVFYAWHTANDATEKYARYICPKCAAV